MIVIEFYPRVVRRGRGSMVYRSYPGTQEGPKDVITKAALSTQYFNTLGDVLTARQTGSYPRRYSL